MGLFDKLKKKKAVTEEAVSDLVNSVSEEEVTGDEAVEAAEVAETTAAVEAEEVTPVQEDEDGERRFTILVEQAFQMEGDEGVLAVGELFGKMKQGDRIYVLFPNNRMVITTVEDMEVGPGRVAAEAENEKVAVRLADIKRKEQVPQYTVISNYASLHEMLLHGAETVWAGDILMAQYLPSVIMQVSRRRINNALSMGYTAMVAVGAAEYTALKNVEQTQVEILSLEDLIL